jgi:aldehyde:ferredoxin oxidoreductase
MTRVLVASVATGKSDVRDFAWPLRNGPIHAALAHHYVAADARDFLIIARGPVAGYPVVGVQVATITAVSPQGGGIAEAAIEGPLARMLLRLGLDALVLQGRASAVSGLRISLDGKGLRAELERSVVDSGLGVWATDGALRQSSDDVIATTGELGMDGHPAASVVVNNGFPSAQGGLGAVLGTMNLKYLVLTAPQNDLLPTPTQTRITEGYVAAIDGNPLTASERNYPGFALWPAAELVGYAGSQRFAGTVGPGLAGFSGQGFMPYALDDGANACPGCPQACLKSFSVDPSAPVDGGRAHQLAMSAMASQGDETEPRRMIEFNATCHNLGVEHLAAEESLAELGGAHEGNLSEAVVAALTRYPEGSGAALRIKGMAIPPFDPRGNQGLGVGFALNPTGPRYDVLEHDIDFDSDQPWMEREGIGREFGIPAGGLKLGTLGADRHKSLELLWLAWSGLDALGVCEYAAPPTRELTLQSVAELVRDVTGEAFSDSDIYDQGRIRLAFLRQCNALLGLDERHDALPAHFHDSPIGEGRLEGVTVDRAEFTAAADYLYEVFGWDATGLASGHELRHRVDKVNEELGSQLEGINR